MEFLVNLSGLEIIVIAAVALAMSGSAIGRDWLPWVIGTLLVSALIVPGDLYSLLIIGMPLTAIVVYCVRTSRRKNVSAAVQ